MSFNEQKDYQEFIKLKYYLSENKDEDTNLFIFNQDNSVLTNEYFNYYLNKLKV